MSFAAGTRCTLSDRTKRDPLAPSPLMAVR